VSSEDRDPPPPGFQDSVQIGDNISGARAGDIIIGSGNEELIPHCPQCLTPLSIEHNKGLFCLQESCSTNFCEHCESFYRAERNRGDAPYCVDHYTPPVEGDDSSNANIEKSAKDAINDAISDFEKILLGDNFESTMIPEPLPPIPQFVEVRIIKKELYNSYGGASYGLNPDKLGLICNFKNEFKKPIRAFKGKLRFSDLFHHHIMSINVTIELKIAHGKIKKWEGAIDYNQFKSDHARLASIKLSDLQYELELDSVVFIDNTVIPSNQ